MALFRTVGPQAEPVSLAEARAHLRLDHESEDALVTSLIRAAREEVEAACGLALIAQDWRLTLDRLPGSKLVTLRRHPVVEILSVTVYGAEGEASLVAGDRYTLDRHSRPARLHFAEAPQPRVAMNGIEIDFRAGFGEAGTDVPDLLKRAILTLVAHWFEFRAAFGADSQPVSFPIGYERLIAPFRAGRL